MIEAHHKVRALEPAHELLRAVLAEYLVAMVLGAIGHAQRHSHFMLFSPAADIICRALGFEIEINNVHVLLRAGGYRKSGSTDCQSALQLAVEEAHDLASLLVIDHALLDELAGVDNGSVIPAAKGVADVRERHARVLTAEIHGKLAGQRDVRRAPLAAHIRNAHIEMLRHTALDLVDCDGFLGLFLEDVAQEVFNHIACDLPIAQ
jgi:hypothetical protein